MKYSPSSLPTPTLQAVSYFLASTPRPPPLRLLFRRPLSTAAHHRWGPPPKGTKVHICLSGGVDSSVAGRLLLEQGFELAPVFMRNWDTLDEASGSGGCEWEKDWEDVRTICRESLGGVKPELMDLSREYWAQVFEPALESFSAGVTPNPDVTCNREIKFRALPDRLLARDPSAWIATGHYARLLPSPVDPTEPSLHRGSFLPKDQSYYLSTSPIAALSRTLFPLGELSKAEVRTLARQWDLSTSERAESMGICFVGVRKDFSSFLDSYLPASPGNIETLAGKVVGTHAGLWTYTIGEGARLSGFPEKMYVGRKDIARNVVVIVPRSSPILQCEAVATSDFKWISPSHPPPAIDALEGYRVSAQTRSLQPGSLTDCVVRCSSDGSLAIEFLSPLFGVSPGQNVVLYDGTWCLGGGTISRTRTADEGMGEDAVVGTPSPT